MKGHHRKYVNSYETNGYKIAQRAPGLGLIAFRRLGFITFTWFWKIPQLCVFLPSKKHMP